MLWPQLRRPLVDLSVRLAPLASRSFASQKHKKLIKMAKGYRGRGKNVYSVALQRVQKALQYAYRDRRVKKREVRKTWIERLNAATRQHGLPCVTPCRPTCYCPSPHAPCLPGTRISYLGSRGRAST